MLNNNAQGLTFAAESSQKSLKVTEENLWPALSITDASCEDGQITFTIMSVQSKQSNPDENNILEKKESKVRRSNADFVWLHNSYTESMQYQGLLIPPVPPKPNFDSAREKYYHLNSIEKEISEAEFQILKEELNSEYLVLFKKAVARHEYFLRVLINHPYLQKSEDLEIFMQYEKELQLRSRNTLETLGWLISSLKVNTERQVTIYSTEDKDQQLRQSKLHLLRWQQLLRPVRTHALNQTNQLQALAQDCQQISALIHEMSSISEFSLPSDRYASERHSWTLISKSLAGTYFILKKTLVGLAIDVEWRVADMLSDDDALNTAALDLLYRRLAVLHEFCVLTTRLEVAQRRQTSTASLDMNSRNTQLDLAQQHEATWQRLDHISKSAKSELENLQQMRLSNYTRNLTDYAVSQIKQNKEILANLNECLRSFKN